jgi:hypothetical protein
MSQSRRFVVVDGREVEASSPVGFFQALQRTERVPPAALGHYLDLIQRRAAFYYRLDLDLGDPTLDAAARCDVALASLMDHGWVRMNPACPTHPAPRPHVV